MNNLLRYQRKIPKCDIFFNAGISNGLVISKKNYLCTDRRFFTDRTITESKVIEAERKYEQGLLTGAGIGLNSFTLGIRYETGNGMPGYELSSSVRRGYLLPVYRF